MSVELREAIIWIVPCFYCRTPRGQLAFIQFSAALYISPKFRPAQSTRPQQYYYYMDSEGVLRMPVVAYSTAK